MAVMELHYDHLLVTTSGYSVKFTKGEPREVPDGAVDEASKLGARLIEGTLEVPPVKAANTVPSSGFGRDTAIKQALEVIKEKNNSADFAGTGRPRMPVVKRMVGFAVDATEVDALWDEMTSDVA